MKIGAIIQARMESTRLPGKVLLHAAGKPLLFYLINRIKNSDKLDEISIATGKSVENNIIENFCANMKIKCIRGSDNDVLSRYRSSADEMNIDLVVRLTGDNILVDSDLIDKTIQTYLDNKYDYVSTCCPPPRTYPEGYTIEVFSREILTELYKNANKPSDREHVTFSLWMKKKYKTFRLDLPKDLSKYRLTLDYPEDYKVIKSIIEDLYPRNPDFKMMDVIKWLDEHPKIYSVNSKIKPNQGWLPSFEADKKAGF